MSGRRESGDSVFDEPHLRPPPPPPVDANRAPIDSVWMEPSHAPADPAAPRPWSDWYRARRAEASPARAWGRTLLLSLTAGPLAVFAALLYTSGTHRMLLLVVVGPVVEEIGKIMGPLMVVERGPHRFTSAAQPVVCGLAAGLMFAVIENFLYLHVYVPDATPALAHWRWTVCVALHTGCSFAAACGVAKVWRETDRTLQPPRLKTGLPLLLSAIIIHGVYNFLAILIDPLFLQP